MAVSCDPATLVAAAKCFACIPQEMRKPVELYLLAVAAGGSTDPETLIKAAAAAGFRSVPKEVQEPLELYLLCKAAGGT